MARQLVCDGCGAVHPDNESTRQEFSLVEVKKLHAGSPVLKVYELCKDCTSQVQAVIARLAVKVLG